MIQTDEAIIIYDALVTVFDVPNIGGALTQRKNSFTGEFTVDRTICPMSLTPTITVKDPNLDDETSDQTSLLVTSWFFVTQENGAEVETPIGNNTSDDIYYSGKNLMVERNVEAGDIVIIRLKAVYYNPHTTEPMHFTRDFTLSTTTYLMYNPAIAVDIPNYSTVSPFHLIDDGSASDNHLRTVTAKFFSGSQDISTNSRLVFTWEKKDGSSYRAIAATDVEVVSISGRQMVLDLTCVGRVKYRVTAYHQDFDAADYRKSYTFTVNRQMSGFTLKPVVVRGKLLKLNVTESEAEAQLSVNSNAVDNPGKFFTFYWTFYRQNGTSREGTTFLGTGPSVKAGRSLSGYDKTKRPTFQMESHPLSEYRLLVDDNGDPVTGDSNELIIGQVED